MLSFIATLQRKPERVKKRIAVVASAALTSVIVIFWLISISVNEAAPVAVSEKKEDGPFQAFTDGVGLLFSDAAETLQGAVGVFGAFSNEASSTDTSSE